MRARFRLPRLSRKEVERDELYLSQGLKTVALSFASVFIPIYFYQLGYGLSGVITIYLFFELSWLAFSLPAGYAIARFGANRMLILSYLLTLSYLFVLSGTKDLPWLIPVFVVLAGAAMALEMTSVHTQMSAARERGKTGHAVGMYEIVIKVSRAIGPIIGAAIATVFGPEDLFMSAAIIVALGALPLLTTRDIVRQHRIEYRRLKWGQIKREMVSIGGRSVPVFIGGQLWPIYIFLALKTFTGVGAVHSLAYGLSIVAVIVSARLIDAGSKVNLMKLGAWTEMIGNGLRIVSSSFAPFMGATLLGSLGASFMNGPWLSRFYDRANEGHRIEYIVKIDIAARLWSISAAGLLLGLCYILPEMVVLRTSFVLAAVAGFLVVLMPRGSRKRSALPLSSSEHLAAARI